MLQLVIQRIPQNKQWNERYSGNVGAIRVLEQIYESQVVVISMTRLKSEVRPVPSIPLNPAVYSFAATAINI